MGGQQANHFPAAPPQQAVNEGWAVEAAELGFSLQELAGEESQRAARLEVEQGASHGMAQEEGECWKHLAN